MAAHSEMIGETAWRVPVGTSGREIVFRGAVSSIVGNWLRSDCPVSLLIISGPSGVGKSTLLTHIYRNRSEILLAGRSTTFVSFLPQRARRVQHWRVRDLIPMSSKLEETFFSPSERIGLGEKRLAELSGGQIARVLLLSAIERARHTPQPTRVILLDEALEGVDNQAATVALQGLLDRLAAIDPGIVYRVALVSHAQLNLHGNSSARLSNARLQSDDESDQDSSKGMRDVLVTSGEGM